jgi:glycosyltransferase involved in cell wall biosynthesis
MSSATGPRPPISVLITAFQAERFLGAALDSALAQTLPPTEIIVVDDGSTDGTADVVRTYGDHVQLVEVSHGGVSRGRNHAMESATGELWAFLDADDLWRSTKLELQVAALHGPPSLDAVFCLVDEFIDKEQRGSAGSRAPGLARSGPLPSGLLIRAEAARRVGPFDPTRDHGDWLDWWGRATLLPLLHGEVDEVLCDRRIHGANSTLSRQATGDAYLSALRDRIRRGRAEP